MNSKILISTKSSGLCFNIMRLIILSKISKEYNRKLYFLTKPDHIPILKKFNNKCEYIPYIEGHTKQFNNFTRKKSLHILYDLKYVKFLKENYLDKIFNTPNISEFEFICGSKYDITNSDKKFLTIDYNDGDNDTKIINSIDYKFDVSNINYKLDYNTITVNVKINNSKNKRIYKLWDKLIPELKKFNKPIMLISGNNDIKKYLGDKHGCLYYETNSETNYSNIRGNDITRGKPEAIFNDVIKCCTTHFIPFTYFRHTHKDILSEFSDINFVFEKVEKFDILVEYLSPAFN